MANTPDIQGEGNYDAARNFDQAEQAFVKKGGIEKKARDAEQALDGPEGAELERARQDGAKGDPRRTGLKADKSFDPKG
jgi:hypothetical protein